MIFKALDDLVNIFKDEPDVLQDISQLRKAIEKLFATEKCLLCGGLGHSAGKKCPSLIRMLSICRNCCVPGTERIFLYRFNSNLKHFQSIIRAQLQAQAVHKESLTGLKLRTLLPILKNKANTTQAKKAKKLQQKLLQRQIDEPNSLIVEQKNIDMMNVALNKLKNSEVSELLTKVQRNE